MKPRYIFLILLCAPIYLFFINKYWNNAEVMSWIFFLPIFVTSVLYTLINLAYAFTKETYSNYDDYDYPFYMNKARKILIIYWIAVLLDKIDNLFL